MRNTIRIKDMSYRYNLQSVADMDYRIFVDAASNELKTQVVWANMPKQKATEILTVLVNDILDQELTEPE